MKKFISKVTAFSPKVVSLLGLGLLLPRLADAVVCNPYPVTGTVEFIICKINDILNIIVPVLITLGVVYFVWGVIQYITAKDEEKQGEARKIMISGIIGLFVIVSIWGLVALISKTFGTGNGANTQYTAPVF